MRVSGPGGLLLFVAWASASGGPSAEQAVRLSLPEWTGSVTCSIVDGDRSIDGVNGTRHLTLPCPGGSEVLRCEVAAGEPLDLPLAAACAANALPAMPATRVRIEGADHPDLQIEWLHFDETGDFRIVARRPAAHSPATLPISHSENRLIRFSRPGAAPVTVPARDLATGEAWRLPPPVPGGELTLRRARSRVAPRAYRLAGAHAGGIHAHGAGDFVFVRNIPPGRYDLTPLYDGDIAGEVHPVRVEAGRSAAVFVPPADVGAVVLNIENSRLCLDSTRLRLIRTEDYVTTTAEVTSRSTSKEEFATVARTATCEQPIAGLPPGQYEAALEADRDGVLTTRRFDIARQTVSYVVVDVVARLSGTVTFNDEPFAGAVLELSRGVTGEKIASAEVDERGHYSVDLELAGSHRVSLRSTPTVALPGEDRSVEIEPGENLFDLALEGGTLTVRLENVDSSLGREITLTLIQREPPVRTGRPGSVRTVRSDDPEMAERQVIFTGLAYGTYSIRGRQAGGDEGRAPVTSSEVRFTLSKNEPEATVTLAFNENAGTVTLVGPAGEPVQNARVFRDGIRPRELEPGVFSLEGVPPGFPLLVLAAGYTPQCISPPADVATTVRLETGRQVEVRYRGAPAGARTPLGYVTWFGSGCEIALGSFPYRALPADTDGAPRFLLSNFPATAEVTFTTRGGQAPRRLQVTGDVLEVPYDAERPPTREARRYP